MCWAGLGKEVDFLKSYYVQKGNMFTKYFSKYLAARPYNYSFYRLQSKLKVMKDPSLIMSNPN